MHNILLIGDNCIDEYRYGTIDRISPEAPVPVFKFSHMETKPGMAGNVKLNLEAFGINVNPLLSAESRKTRLIDLRSKQHVLRIDEDLQADPLIISTAALRGVDAIVFSDYNKGFISYELVEDVRRVYKGPIFIDTKKRDLVRFNGCIVKVNEHEFNQRTSICDNLVVTLGADGALHKKDDEENYFPGHPVEVVDVCGAGDTFLSAMVSEYLNTRDISMAISMANKASSIAVQHSGVYTLTKDDIKSIKI
jgi:D-beta-D-heptose 7-phosphate kinase/D-beta-D-heptose 1-phosphate adenosyltransferase